MTPERRLRTEQLYHAALQHEESERTAFLREACAGDEDLRREVESLLAEDQATDSFLERPALQVHTWRKSGFSSTAGRPLAMVDDGSR